MQNRTLGIVATVLTSLFCGCFSIISCVWGVIIARGGPVDVTSNGVTTPQTFPPAIGFGLLCLSVIMILIPVAVGFFTLRKKAETSVADTPVA
jgi:hypothetical protein